MPPMLSQHAPVSPVIVSVMQTGTIIAHEYIQIIKFLGIIGIIN